MAGHGLFVEGLRTLLKVGLRLPIAAGLGMLRAGLLTTGLRLHAAWLLLLATGLWVLTTGLLLLVAGLRLLSAGLRLLAGELRRLQGGLRLQLAADPQPSSWGIVVSNQPIGESSWARAGCSVGEGEGGEPSFNLFFSSLLFLSFSLLFAFLGLLLLLALYTGTSMNRERIFSCSPVAATGSRPQTSPDSSGGDQAAGRRVPCMG